MEGPLLTGAVAPPPGGRPSGRPDLGGRRTPQPQVRATAVPAEAGRGRRSESPEVKPTILTLPRPWAPSQSRRATIGAGSCRLPVLAFEPAHSGAGAGWRVSAGRR